MALSFLCKHGFRNPQSIARFFTTQYPNSNGNTFPDKPTSTYYDDLVNAAGIERDFDKIRHLLNKRVRDECFNTTNTFKFITNTDNSLSILDDLTQSLARLNNGYTRASAFESLIARLCKLDRIDESLRVVEIMARGEFGLRALSFHPILNSLTKKRKMDEAWRVVGIIRAVGVSPDLTAFNYLLTGYCFAGNVEAAHGVLKKIDDERLGADTRTYDALVLGACRAGKVEGVLVILRRMEDDGVPVLYSTHAHVINALLKLGYYAQAVKFVMLHEGRERGLDNENFGILASKLIKLKRLEEAMLVLKEMIKRGLAMGEKLRDYYILHSENANVF